MDTQKQRTKIKNLLSDHELWRASTLNLCASENVLSPIAKSNYVSDLMHRYGDYQDRDLNTRKYQGAKYIQQIEEVTRNIAQEIFDAKYVELRGISGQVTDLAVILALTTPGGLIFELGANAGGHRDGIKLSSNPLVNTKVEFLPFDADEFNIDLDNTISMMRALRPSLIKLGSSNFLFPHPVADIVDEAMRLGNMIVAYDASHVLGLIAGNTFQNPLGGGADVVMGSTHKTLPGPQGGIILSNNISIIEKISAATYPIMVSNHHLHRYPALAITLLEMQEFGNIYAFQTINNAKALGDALHRMGIPVVGARKGYTQSHTLLLQTSSFGKSSEIAWELENVNIIVTACRLPSKLGGEGLRIGVQEMTRMGMKEKHMSQVAEFLCEVINGQDEPNIHKDEVSEFRREFNNIQYTFDLEDTDQ